MVKVKKDNSEVLISIIFPSFNGEEVLYKNLNSIRNLTNLNEIELVIIDNNSRDSTKTLVKSFKGLDINLIEQKSNLGFAKACNIGVLHSKGKYIFITNQDVIFPSDFFVVLLNLFNKIKYSRDIILCPSIVFLGDNGINYFGAKIHFLCFSYTPEMYQKLPKTKKTFRTLKISGSSMFLKKNTFLKLNGFDPYFFMYHEDTDLSLKALRNNIPVLTTNETRLYHQKNSFILNDFSYYYIERNRYICLVKNLESIVKLIPYILITEIFLLFQSILIKKFSLKIRIYCELFSKKKFLKELRKKSKQEIVLLPYQNLSKSLDPILFGNIKNKRIFQFFLNVLNFFLKLA